MTTQTDIDTLSDSANRNPEWAGSTPVVNPVPGGLTNHNFRLSMTGIEHEIFAKIPGPGTEAFIDRSVANAAARQAAEVGISPRVLFFDDKTGIEYSEFLGEGYRTATTLDFQSMELLEKIIDIYQAWHKTPPLPQTKTMLDMVDEHLDQVRGSAIALPSWADDVVEAYGRAAERFRASGLTLVPAHNDPMPGNFLLGDDGSVKLVDFDYAANNEVTYELALLFTEMFTSVDDTRVLVRRYRGKDDEAFFARVMVCRMICDTKWGLWGLINNAVRDEEFDYYKYGTWKLYRSFLVSKHPQFEEWLDLI
ncbi:choline/ethanolamine kinase family protein [Arthrobacter sp. L77]|uniref:choline/ethanolamine kinase family protein n=1 Tax=Arthrobacter sp. L77 TaxID=1496689 RepID=UPI0005B92DEF|nr:choline/ethanolamine kinase family protein [Arthrobacter sp. L77]